MTEDEMRTALEIIGKSAAAAGESVAFAHREADVASALADKIIALLERENAELRQDNAQMRRQGARPDERFDALVDARKEALLVIDEMRATFGELKLGTRRGPTTAVCTVAMLRKLEQDIIRWLQTYG